MKIILVIAAFCVFLAFLRLLELFWLAKDKKEGKVFSRWSIYGLSALYVLLLSCSAAEFVLGPAELYWPLSAAGLLLMSARVGLKIWSAKTLSKFWSFHVEIRDDHELIIAGPYKYIRHPAYLSAFVDAIGIVMFFNALYSAALFVPLMTLMLYIRITTEEKQLIIKFGDKYKSYIKRTNAVIPFRQFGIGKP